MATRKWLGNALPVAQVTTITIADTWAAGDTATLTINGKDLVLTVGTDDTTANVATALKEMFNGDAQSGSGDHTFSETGDNVPEFDEITATVSSSTVTLTGDVKGTPFTITVAETTAGDGTVGSPSESTAPTGPNHWDNADNWSGGAVPVDADDVVIEDSAVDILYGLDQNAVSLTTLKILQSFTGKIGLPERNSNDYNEYRDTYLKTSNSGDATTMTLTIGEGEGSGSGRIKIDCNTGQTIALIYNTGTPESDNLPALLLKGTHASNTINIQKGSVGIAVLAGETAAVATLKVGYVNNQAGDVSLECGSGVTLTNVDQSGGEITLQSAVTTHDQWGGELNYLGSGALGTLSLYEGTANYQSSGTLTTANIYDGGIFDLRKDMRARTITNVNLYSGGSFLDPFGTATLTNGVDLEGASLGDVTLDLGTHLTVTPSSI